MEFSWKIGLNHNKKIEYSYILWSASCSMTLAAYDWTLQSSSFIDMTMLEKIPLIASWNIARTGP
jgi:hypothetical protein